jgi:hypothetical protein
MHWGGVGERVSIQRTAEQVLLPSLTVTPHSSSTGLKRPLPQVATSCLFPPKVPLHLYKIEVACPLSDSKQTHVCHDTLVCMFCDETFFFR